MQLGTHYSVRRTIGRGLPNRDVAVETFRVVLLDVHQHAAETSEPSNQGLIVPAETNPELDP
jgi:hypothetical protein